MPENIIRKALTFSKSIHNNFIQSSLNSDSVKVSNPARGVSEICDGENL